MVLCWKIRVSFEESKSANRDEELLSIFGAGGYNECVPSPPARNSRERGDSLQGRYPSHGNTRLSRGAVTGPCLS